MERPDQLDLEIVALQADSLADASHALHEAGEHHEAIQTAVTYLYTQLDEIVELLKLGPDERLERLRELLTLLLHEINNIEDDDGRGATGGAK